MGSLRLRPLLSHVGTSALFMNSPPVSIFTGSATTAATANTDTHRLTTPEYIKSFAAGAEAEKPSTPREHPSAEHTTITTTTASSLLPPHEIPWTQRIPDDCSSEPPRIGRRRGAVKTPPAVAGKKRHGDLSPLLPAPTSEPLLKRRRVSRTRHSLDHFSFVRASQLHKDRDGQPPSPLFFSHTRRIRPYLPARFSSSEAAARMLSRTSEDSGIKTVTLARGTFSGLSPPGPTGAASGRSSERSSLPPRTASPDGRDRNDPLRLLGSVGIVELLEQDNRPTFIVDIGDNVNHAHENSGLQILFANSALRSKPMMWELVAGKPSSASGEDPTALASGQFKSWLLSTVIQGESLDVNPSPVEHGGIVWSCYTLRKRLRVASGAIPGPPPSSIPSTSASLDFAAHSSSLRPTPTTGAAPSPAPVQEPQDYFGNGAPVAMVNDLDQEPHSAMSPEHVPRSEPVSADKPSIMPFQRPDRLELPDFNGHPSFTNECVLRAHAAGDVDAFHRAPSPPQEHDVGFFDWTRLSLSPSLPRHIQFARAIDWASTPLGPIEFWSNDLRAMCNLIM